MFKIEKVDPEVLALLQSGKRRGVKQYPFAEMEVGDSFAVEQGKAAGRAKNAARTFSSRKGVKFATFRDGAGWRIVRIA